MTTGNPGGWFHPEEYQASVHETMWKAIKARPFLWGSFVWNMFDFASDARSEGGTPGLNDKGLVSYDRLVKKDAFYYYAANWSPQPTVHLDGKRWNCRQDAVADVKVYANARRVTLWLGHRRIGTQQGSADHVFVWKGLSLRPGVNVVTVLGTGRHWSRIDRAYWRLSPSCPADGYAPA